MVNVPSPFGGSDDTFDAYDEFVPEHAPAPGDFLEGHDVLDGREHLAVHRLARELFEERGVYDVTFGYNLARLNNDRRHTDAGYRYAVERSAAVADDLSIPDGDGESAGHEPARVLRAEFTPTTAFCPQSDTLSRGSLRAWNGLAGCHEFDLVRVRVAPTHQRAGQINAALREAEAALVETGSLPEPENGDAGTPGNGFDDDVAGAPGRDGSRSPF
ncbi:hypothetical protein I7X12_10220 [Halosimplex litoreum]|uniref:DUF7998 domain-containing protein n=1 Tax=Halosimplex litoreum TaxID=1198301 RepID=A0A7U3WBF5_9EURY|nr:hypothetical protein [Halosimplex litoreum]QPV64950.1 hypothetical protein I7X12_10220 [Halosimplex litoreum]